MLDQLGRRPDIVALAYHVVYWDYIGWADTFGAPEYSDRQRDYAQSWGSSRIFTPQLIVNGAGGVLASKPEAVEAALGDAVLPLTIALTCDDDDQMMEVSIAAGEDLDDAVVWLITFIERSEVDIERGENKGQKVAYTQIVTSRQVAGMWEPATGAHLKLPLDEVLTGRSNGVTILVPQERDALTGRMLGP